MLISGWGFDTNAGDLFFFFVLIAMVLWALYFPGETSYVCDFRDFENAYKSRDCVRMDLGVVEAIIHSSLHIEGKYQREVMKYTIFNSR
jgi:hypothetical protein